MTAHYSNTKSFVFDDLDDIDGFTSAAVGKAYGLNKRTGGIFTPAELEDASVPPHLEGIPDYTIAYNQHDYEASGNSIINSGSGGGQFNLQGGTAHRNAEDMASLYVDTPFSTIATTDRTMIFDGGCTIFYCGYVEPFMMQYGVDTFIQWPQDENWTELKMGGAGIQSPTNSLETYYNTPVTIAIRMSSTHGYEVVVVNQFGGRGIYKASLSHWTQPSVNSILTMFSAGARFKFYYHFNEWLNDDHWSTWIEKVRQEGTPSSIRELGVLKTYPALDVNYDSTLRNVDGALGVTPNTSHYINRDGEYTYIEEPVKDFNFKYTTEKLSYNAGTSEVNTILNDSRLSALEATPKNYDLELSNTVGVNPAIVDDDGFLVTNDSIYVSFKKDIPTTLLFGGDASDSFNTFFLVKKQDLTTISTAPTTYTIDVSFGDTSGWRVGMPSNHDVGNTLYKIREFRSTGNGVRNIAGETFKGRAVVLGGRRSDTNVNVDYILGGIEGFNKELVPINPPNVNESTGKIVLFSDYTEGLGARSNQSFKALYMWNRRLENAEYYNMANWLKKRYCTIVPQVKFRWTSSGTPPLDIGDDQDMQFDGNSNAYLERTNTYTFYCPTSGLYAVDFSMWVEPTPTTYDGHVYTSINPNGLGSFDTTMPILNQVSIPIVSTPASPTEKRFNATGSIRLNRTDLVRIKSILTVGGPTTTAIAQGYCQLTWIGN